MTMGGIGGESRAGLGGRAGMTMGGFSGPGGPGGPGGRPGSIAGSSDGDDEENLNLLEVAIYGVASLYEKYPPRTAEEIAALTAGTAPAGQPAGQTKP